MRPLAAALLCLCSPAFAALPADVDWVTGYHHAGVQGAVSAMLSCPVTGSTTA